MNYFADFDRHVIGGRNEGIRHEVRTLRLEKRLRENGKPRPGAACRFRLEEHAAAATQGWARGLDGGRNAPGRDRDLRQGPQPLLPAARRLLRRRGYAFEEVDVCDDGLRGGLIEDTGRETLPLVFLGGRPR